MPFMLKVYARTGSMCETEKSVFDLGVTPKYEFIYYYSPRHSLFSRLPGNFEAIKSRERL